MPSLQSLVAAEHQTWDDPVVEKAIFGFSDPKLVANAFSSYCTSVLGAPIADAHFYRVSVACVAGVHLVDGREAVIKAQNGGRRADYLQACIEYKKQLARTGFPCPTPLAPPEKQHGAWFTSEELLTRGHPADAHDPQIRRSLVSALARLEAFSTQFPNPERFGRAWFTGLPPERVFPKPHTPFLNFETTAQGAEWIENLAARARAQNSAGSHSRMVGHFDFRIEHLRFEGDAIVASFDWDSLHYESAAILIGTLAPHFTADWQRDNIVRAPSISEMEDFVTEFEAARNAPFTKEERRLLSAACVYAMAYTARCNHALNSTEEGWNGDLRPLLRAHGDWLLEKGL